MTHVHELMQELRSATESQHLRTSKCSLDVKNITLRARELILWRKKTNFGEGDFTHRLEKLQEEGHMEDCRQIGIP